ncbi:probable cytochrome P450 301a1, mitochondrial [Dermacentor silvarum]|uniref:probable cytochrome P450 301a1, mitochondrial n=1 Tax=Dermacentor silvarum TaxID=543639 RepID=UPI002101C96B|nr:probable cytochrome P450 301a1, mitochondrial [Dermacentor silvarum]
MLVAKACRRTKQRKLPSFQVSKLRFSVTALSCADRLTFAKPFSDVPRIPAFPVVGSSWIYFPILGRYNIRKLNEAAWDMYQRYGPVVGEQIPGRRVLVHLFSADDIRTLYQEEGRTPYRMGALPFKLYHTDRKEYFANEGILNLQGEQWHQIRTAVQPCTFRPRTVELYAEGMGQIADDAVELIASDRDGNGDVLDCYTIMQRWALEAVMLVSLDKRLGLLENPLPPDSDAAGIMNGIVTLFSDMDKLVTGFPYYRYFATPTIRSFQRTGDYLVSYGYSIEGKKLCRPSPIYADDLILIASSYEELRLPYAAVQILGICKSYQKSSMEAPGLLQPHLTMAFATSFSAFWIGRFTP